MPDPEDIFNAMMKIMQEERLAKGLNYEEFSAASKLHRTTIPRYENGSVVPTVLAAIKMAQALNLDFSEIIFRAEVSSAKRDA